MEWVTPNDTRPQGGSFLSGEDGRKGRRFAGPKVECFAGGVLWRDMKTLLRVAALLMCLVARSSSQATASHRLSLRHQLAHTAIQVIEICPPAVNTDLGGSGLLSRGTPLKEFAAGAFRRDTIR